MGSKSGPAPDPRLTDAQINSLDAQNDFMSRIVANSERLQPMQEEQMRYGLAAAQRAEGLSMEDRQWMLGRRDRLQTVQDGLLDEADSFNSTAMSDRLSSQGIGDVRQQFDVQRDAMARGLSRQGVSPESGRALGMRNQMAMGEALAAAKVSQAASMEGINIRERKHTNAVNMLAGYPGMAANATGAAAGFGMAGQGIVGQGLAGMNAGWGAAGNMAGQMGQNASGAMNARSNWDKAHEDNTWGTILGAAAGAGTSFGLGKLFG